MYLEVLQYTKMSQTGKDILKIMQNKTFTLLDLLVRESLQNSLDAAIGDEKVDVSFLTSSFSVSSFINCLGPEDKLAKVLYVDNDISDYFAIVDKGTVGLTGSSDPDEIKKGESNLSKLVYHISKNQTGEGKGGSYGYGKSIYYQIGNGIVVYYSRIQDGDTYSSRLVVCFIEDEKNPQSIFSKAKVQGAGVAWWGQRAFDGSVIPITSETEIEQVLSVFNIPKYGEKETGTTVIVPFFKRDELLQEVKSSLVDDEAVSIIPNRIYSSIESYLAFSVQKWYFPRLNNPYYGKSFLDFKLNSSRIRKECFFQLCTELYNYANNKVEKECFHKKAIELKNVFKDGMTAGNLAYVLAEPELLQLLPPDNNPNPLNFLNKSAEEKKPPIFMFTRQPGMIISYEVDSSRWIKESITSENNLVAIFVPNGKKEFKDEKKDKLGFNNLEMYLRSCENSCHNSWNDSNQGEKIIQKFQDKVSHELINLCVKKEEFVEGAVDYLLGSEMGSMFLPPDGYGTRSSSKVSKAQTNKIVAQKGYFFEQQNGKEIEYLQNTIGFPFVLTFSSDIKVQISMKVNQDGNTQISKKEWEESFGNLPFPCKFSRLKLESLSTQLSLQNDLRKDIGEVNIVFLEKQQVLEVKTFSSRQQCIQGVLYYYCAGEWETAISVGGDKLLCL